MRDILKSPRLALIVGVLLYLFSFGARAPSWKIKDIFWRY